MIIKNFVIFYFLSVLIPLVYSALNESESEDDKIKNTIISMFLINTNDYLPSFYFRFKKLNFNFSHYSLLDIAKDDIIFNEDPIDKKKYILNNVMITFKSRITFNGFDSFLVIILIEVRFDVISFILNNDNMLIINEVVPSSIYIAPNNQISYLSFFDEFNKMNTTTYIDEKGKIHENTSINTTLLEISKQCVLNKIQNTQNSFNLLTYYFDKFLNYIIGKNVTCPKNIIDNFSVKSMVIETIDAPVKNLSLENKLLYIDNMKIRGKLFYLRYPNLINFGFSNTAENPANFDKNNFNLNIKQNHIIDNFYIKRNVMQTILNECLNSFIQTELKEFFS